MCGYRDEVPLSSNLIVIVALLFALLVLVVVYNFIAKLRKKKTQLMARICNFSLRFFLEFFLELCLSMIILAATMKSNDSVAWILTMFALAASIAFIVLAVTRFFTGGPYVPKSY